MITEMNDVLASEKLRKTSKGLFAIQSDALKGSQLFIMLKNPNILQGLTITLMSGNGVCVDC